MRVGNRELDLVRIPKIVKAALSSTFYRVGQVRTIFAGPCRGLKYRIFPDMGLSPLYGGWEADAQSLMVKHVGKGTVAYDVGANYGIHALLMARLVGSEGHVYVFEPVPAIRAELELNVALNHFANVTCVELAVSNECGEAQFSVNGHVGAGHFATNKSEGSSNIKVRTVTIDEFVRSGRGKPPQFMKIDVEGAESRVLSGALEVFKQHRPTVLVDLHNPDEDRAVGAILSQSGYDAWRIKEGLTKIARLDVGWPTPDGIWGQVIALPR